MGSQPNILQEAKWKPACLDPWDLNKANLNECYIAPMLNNISLQLSSDMVFSKLDAKSGFLSIHLDNPISLLTTFDTHKDIVIHDDMCL